MNLKLNTRDLTGHEFGQWVVLRLAGYVKNDKIYGNLGFSTGIIASKMASHSSAYLAGKTTASLDRIDSGGDYQIGNIHWVHKDVNVMKNVFSSGRFIEVCRAVVGHHDKAED